MCTADHGIPRYLDCGLPRRKYAHHELPRRKWSYRRLPQSRAWIWERLVTGLDWPHLTLATWECCSALHMRAVCQGVIPVFANRGILESCSPRNYFCWGKPQCWSAVCHKRVKSATSHFTSTVPLFDASFIFDAWLDMYKTYTRRGF
jgi:hypothetical protein